MTAILNIGAWAFPDGTKHKGYYVINPVNGVSKEAIRILKDTAGDTIFAGPQKIALVNGSSSIAIPATDDPDDNPTDFAWNVKLYLEKDIKVVEKTFDIADGTT